MIELKDALKANMRQDNGTNRAEDAADSSSGGSWTGSARASIDSSAVEKAVMRRAAPPANLRPKGSRENGELRPNNSDPEEERAGG